MKIVRESDLFIFGMIITVLLILFGVLFYLFHSPWIIALGALCGSGFVLGFAYLDKAHAPPLPFEKPSIDHDDRGWQRLNRPA